MRRDHAWTWTLFVSCCILAGCGGGGGPSAPLTAGVQGRAVQGPTSPLSQPGEVNEEALPGALITIQRPNGAEVARQVTDTQGDFKIRLSPGTYRLVALAPNGKSGPPTPPAPQDVTIAADQFVTVNVSYDTGIR